MSQTTRKLAISEHADEIEAAAEDADDQERRDAGIALAAIARGEPVPKPVARRIKRRLGETQ